MHGGGGMRVALDSDAFLMRDQETAVAAGGVEHAIGWRGNRPTYERPNYIIGRVVRAKCFSP